MEVQQRVANIIRFLSMASVIGALLFMYAYGTDDHAIRSTDQTWISAWSKTNIFYVVLLIFGIFNLLLNWGSRTYRESTGFDGKSFLFKSELHKSRILFWFTLFIAAINFLIASFVGYLGFIKIDGVSAESEYLHLPIIGLSIFLIILSGLIWATMTKREA